MARSARIALVGGASSESSSPAGSPTSAAPPGIRPAAAGSSPWRRRSSLVVGETINRLRSANIFSLHPLAARRSVCARCLTFARRDDLLLLVHVVLVALDVAAPALQGRRRLEHVPQWLGACLTVGGEVVQRGDELVALVADVAGLLSDGQRLHGKLRLLFALSLVGVKNLERCWRTRGVS